MTVSFNSVPSSLLVPFVTAEFDNSRAEQGPSLLPYRALLIGQRLPGSSASSDTLYKVSSADRVAQLAGRGSMLHRMAKAFFALNKSTEVWMLPVSDSASASLASGSLTLSGTATADGLISLYIGGESVPVAVTSGQSASAIAANVAAAIGKRAVGTVAPTSAQAGDTFTIAGTSEAGESISVTFTGVAGAATPGAATFSIDTDDAAARASIKAQIQAHADASKIVRPLVIGSSVSLFSITGATASNAFTLASSHVSRMAVSGATLSGATGETDLPVFANSAAGVVSLFAMNNGAVANELDVRLNYNDGEELPAGVGLVISGMAGGASNPSLTGAISALGDSWFQIFAMPYTDSTSLTAMEAELSSRFGPMRMIDGAMISAKNDSYSNVANLALGRNSPHSVIIRTNDRPTQPCEIAAAVAAVVSLAGSIDPARPFQTLSLQGAVKAAAETARDTFEERNTLLLDGVATLVDSAGDIVRVERLVTTYKTNAAGSPDTSYRDLNTMLTQMYLRYAWRTRVGNRYPRHKVANDGTRFGAGQAVVTPSLMRAEAIAWFREMEELGLVENFELFKANLVVERNDSDPNRMDLLLPPDLINQLVVTAAKIQPRL